MEHYFTNNDNLKSEYKTIKFNLFNYDFVFTSDNGVFSKDKIDFGSQVLVNNMINKVIPESTILDVGCGYGFIGIVLSKILNSKADMVDVNNRAIHLCEMNIKSNKVDAEVFNSNIYENVSKAYDVIVSNPPIRAGKEVVLTILKDAYKHLNNNGTLWYVIRKDQGAKSITKELEKIYEIECLEKSKGFYIYCAKRIDKDFNLL